MRVTVKMTEDDIRQIIANHISYKWDLNVKPTDLQIQLELKQNYRSEWEIADIRLEQELLLPAR